MNICISDSVLVWNLGFRTLDLIFFVKTQEVCREFFALFPFFAVSHLASAAHIPERRAQLVHYYGAYSNSHRGKRAKSAASPIASLPHSATAVYFLPYGKKSGYNCSRSVAYVTIFRCPVAFAKKQMLILPNRHVLTTQLFFPGEPRNETDFLFLPNLLVKMANARATFDFILIT